MHVAVTSILPGLWFLKHLPWPEGGRTWDLLVFIYIFSHKQHLRPLSYCASPLPLPGICLTAETQKYPFHTNLFFRCLLDYEWLLFLFSLSPGKKDQGNQWIEKKKMAYLFPVFCPFFVFLVFLFM